MSGMCPAVRHWLHCWLCACWRGAPTGEAAAAPWGSSLWPLICWCETWAAQHMGVFVCECVSGVRQRASSRPAALGLCCRMCGAAWGFSGRCSTRCAWLLATHRQVQLGRCAAVAGQRQAAPRLGLGLLHALACCVIVLLGVNGGLIGSAAWRLACAARLQVCVSANAPAVLVLSFFVDLFCACLFCLCGAVVGLRISNGTASVGVIDLYCAFLLCLCCSVVGVRYRNALWCFKSLPCLLALSLRPGRGWVSQHMHLRKVC
ncbi:hypothetical protein COO60DRAFT_611313 [Scenedesmus sp. NREL 46B-D3]|nr:hypothetical protein COO60DRAFT_611313 [Scenedesmus sp. NREL 46B-D3]